MRALRRVVAALAACVAAALVCGCGADPRPSILLVTWDTTRADRVGAYGNEAGLTPNLDRLARSGVVFEDCVTPIGTTVPSHSTMLTGLLPGSHGVRENQQRLAGHLPVVAEALSASGYATGAFVALRLLLTQAGLHRGFERVSDPAGVVARNLARDDDEVLDLAVEWLEELRNSRAPFFGWVHFYGPHTPLEPTPHSRARLRGHPDVSRRVSVGEFYEGAWIDDPKQQQHVHALYDGEVRETDERLGRLLDTLEEIGRTESTVVIVTADHGQALGDNDYRGHDYALWNSILSVPLVVRAPGAVEGLRVEERVGLVDLAPTILELAGQPAFASAEGRSLVAALAGHPLFESTYLAEAPSLSPGEAPPRFQTGHRLAVLSGSHKLVIGDRSELLFDVESDPQEMDTALAARPGRQTALRARLRELAESYARRAVSSSKPSVPEETAEGLRALGYAD